MTPVKLTAFERADIKNSQVIRSAYIDAIVTTIGYMLTTDSGNVAWARSRNYAAKIRKNPSMLLNDSDLMNVFELTMLQRNFDNKDTDTEGTLEEQFLAYMTDGAKFGFLVDDFYAVRNAGLEM